MESIAEEDARDKLKHGPCVRQSSLPHSDKLPGGWFKCPNFWIAGNWLVELTATELKLLLVLKRLAGQRDEAYPSLSFLSKRIGRNCGHISRAAKQLEERGMISRIRGTGPGKPTRYRFPTVVSGATVALGKTVAPGAKQPLRNARKAVAPGANLLRSNKKIHNTGQAEAPPLDPCVALVMELNALAKGRGENELTEREARCIATGYPPDRLKDAVAEIRRKIQDGEIVKGIWRLLRHFKTHKVDRPPDSITTSRRPHLTAGGQILNWGR